MVYQFSNWTDSIAEIAEQFQNAVIRIYDPSLVTANYDIETGEWTYGGSDPDAYEGPARIMPQRWGVNHEGSEVSNASTWTAVTVQVPKNAVGRVKRGVKMVVIECDDNPALLTVLFGLTSDLQGSNAATRTFEFAVDGDVVTDAD